MQPIEFDPVKSQRNFEQHGFHLSHCNFIDWNLLCAIPDIRKPYGEMRWIAFAPIGKLIQGHQFEKSQRKRNTTI